MISQWGGVRLDKRYRGRVRICDGERLNNMPNDSNSAKDAEVFTPGTP